MSALRPNSASSPLLADSPPVVVPSVTSLSPDAAAPQTAAAPPPVPKAEKQRPKIRATKAALSIVRSCFLLYLYLYFLTSLPSRSFCLPAFDALAYHTSQTPEAVKRIRALLRGPTPQLLRIGVRNKGCAGLSYHLEYVDSPGKFDEVVEQDGVRVLIDSKALFSVIGSEMDWKEDSLRCVSCSSPLNSLFLTLILILILSSKFAFKNPNIKDACGCGESFNVS